MTLEEKRIKVNAIKRQQELKQRLKATDYVTAKLTEALVLKEVAGDNTKLVEVYNQYKDILEQREEMRAEINELEAQLASEN